jgi:hypothetical protein
LLVPYYDPGFDGAEFSVPKQIRSFEMQPFQEFYKSVKGAMPSGELWEAYKTLLTVNGTMYRLIAMPPGVPKAAVDALRAAVTQLNEDQAYLDEAQKAMGESPEYVTNADLNVRVRRGLSIKPEIKAFMEAYVKKADNR